MVKICSKILASTENLVEVVNTTYKNADSCSCAYRFFIRTSGIKNCKVMIRGDRVFLKKV